MDLLLFYRSTCITGEMAVVRYLARKFPKSGMYGKTILQATEVGFICSLLLVVKCFMVPRVFCSH